MIKQSCFGVAFNQALLFLIAALLAACPAIVIKPLPDRNINLKIQWYDVN